LPWCRSSQSHFTGRDEAITDERRKAQRYTLSHLAHDMKEQLSIGEPVRDWFPLSFLSTFSDWADLVHGPDAAWGQVACSCHPNCGVGMAIMVDKETPEAVPVTAFLNADSVRQGRCEDQRLGSQQVDIGRGDGAGPGAELRCVSCAEAFPRDRYAEGNSTRAWARPDTTTATSPASGRWMTFSAAGATAGTCCSWRACGSRILFNYDFRRTEQCIIPYATQEGEISFCAYNTGMGWRNIIEKMHMTATLTKWYEEHGRHEIFAGGKSVKLDSTEHHLVLKDEIVTSEAQHDLEQLGIAKNAREEKLRARAERIKQDGIKQDEMKQDEMKQAEENRRMAKLYREFVLKERPLPNLVQIGLGAATPSAEAEREAVSGFGD
jgi:7,8-dihydro-6-hydroxymethylpterin dimethyltransferase